MSIKKFELSAVIVGGKLTGLDQKELQYAIQELAWKTKPETPITITIKRSQKPHSDQQYGYYRLYLNEIAKETGNDKEYLHTLFQTALGPKKTISINGQGYEVAISSTEYTMEEFCEHIRNIEGMTGIHPPETSFYKLNLLSSQLSL